MNADELETQTGGITRDMLWDASLILPKNYGTDLPVVFFEASPCVYHTAALALLDNLPNNEENPDAAD